MSAMGGKRTLAESREWVESGHCGRSLAALEAADRLESPHVLIMQPRMIEVAEPPAVIDGIPRYCDAENYTDNFGFQWNRFVRTQIGQSSEERLFAETGWKPAELDGLDILEVGSGAGRFSRPILERTRANLYSVDYSTAVDANWENNGHIAPNRFHLFQASIYEMPFPDNSFDKTFCLGVLQHTPDFEASVRALVAKTKPGGEIVVDFYRRRPWTKIHAKYLLRPLTRRMSHERLLSLIERNADWMIGAHNLLTRAGLHALTRFLPLADISGTFPKTLSPRDVREWAILDTFDMFSPEFDNPQRPEDVVAMFGRAQARAAFTEIGGATVVRAVKSQAPPNVRNGSIADIPPRG